MATWASVKQYLVSNYTCHEFGDDGLKLIFDLDGGRDQVIIVQWAGSDSGKAAWVDFHSPIGEFGQVDLAEAVRRTGSFVVGGLSSLGDIVTIRASMPLANLDRNEIDDPLNLLVLIADRIEKELTGKDAF